MPHADRRTLRWMLDPHAISIAAARTGTSDAAVAGIVSAYREACTQCEEPVWEMLSHIGGDGLSITTYRAEGTQVLLQIAVSGPGSKDTQRLYAFKSASFESFAEAASFEHRWAIAIERQDEVSLDAMCAVLDAGIA